MQRQSSKVAASAPSSSNLQRMGPRDWCVDCWCEPRDACRAEKHALQDFDGARKGALAEAEALERVLARVRARRHALTEGRARAGLRPLSLPVVQAFCPGGGDCGFEFRGGDVSITLSVTKTLSAEDKRALCAALEDVQLKFDGETGVFTSECGLDVGDGVVGKLQDSEDGQELPAGTVLLVDGSLQVHLQAARHTVSDAGRAKVFGHVTAGLRSLEGRGCQGECFGMEGPDCYCVSGLIWENTTSLNRIKFDA
ncbi:uncharacterized protein LOC117653679 [Thrips palmi]|uniref:Uncharacterized protein LOC117653679 n=1 Tax=Thrips palmi TaxID=161013 RepID=A0A6P9AB83_THRPL|nr:uncharacterized protein LOC117653679 [Thrips palmi]